MITEEQERPYVFLSPGNIKRLFSRYDVKRVKIGEWVFNVETSDDLDDDTLGICSQQNKVLEEHLGFKIGSKSFLISKFSDEDEYRQVKDDNKVTLRVRLADSQFSSEHDYCVLNENALAGGLKSFSREIARHDQKWLFSWQDKEFEMEVSLSKKGFANFPTSSFSLSNRNFYFFREINDLGDQVLQFSVIKGKKADILNANTLPLTIGALKKITSLTEQKSDKDLFFLHSDNLWKVGDYFTVTHEGRTLTLELTRIGKNQEQLYAIHNRFLPNIEITTPMEILAEKMGELKSKFEEVESKGVEGEEGKKEEIPPNLDEESNLTILEKLDKKGVGGAPEVLNELFQPYLDRKDPKKREKYEKWEIEFAKGILFTGPPGTGKTSIAKHIGTILGCGKDEIKVVKGSDILGQYVGETEKGIKAIFQPPEGSDFFVIIIDEIESLCSKRTDHSQDHEGEKVSEFLQQIDGIGSSDKFLLIGITNLPDKMDPAFLRPGRFSHQIEIGLPDQKGREAIFEVYLRSLMKKGCIAEDVNIVKLGEKTEGFSGADIKQSIENAKSRALYHELRNEDLYKLTQKDLMEGINRHEQAKNKAPVTDFLS